jgi:AcrR family transcriptional regulator
MGDTNADAQRLIRKGQATRERITKVAAQLMFERSVAGTSIDDVREAAGVSGSQMTHYFADKRSLVRAVVTWRANTVIELHQLPVLGELDTFEALDLWAELNIASQRRSGFANGCSLGSLAGELAKQDSETLADVAESFERWESLFRHGLGLMKRRGELRSDADTDELAVSLLAALQGGTLLTQANRDVRPMKAALKSAIAYVRSFATDEGERTNTRSKPSAARRAYRVVASL